MFTEFNATSIPKFSVLPIFSITSVYPLVDGILRFINTFLVYDLYTSTEPERRLLKKPKSTPRSNTEVVSQVRFLFDIVLG